jgi:hypothetical protein
MNDPGRDREPPEPPLTGDSSRGSTKVLTFLRWLDPIAWIALEFDRRVRSPESGDYLAYDPFPAARVLYA